MADENGGNSKPILNRLKTFAESIEDLSIRMQKVEKDLDRLLQLIGIKKES